MCIILCCTKKNIFKFFKFADQSKLEEANRAGVAEK